MFEPFLLAENGCSASVRTPYLWHKEHKCSTTEPNDNQLDDEDDDDDVQIVSWKVMPKRQTDTVDLSESIFEIRNDRNDEFVNDDRQTDTMDLSESIFEVTNDKSDGFVNEVYSDRNGVHTNSTTMSNNAVNSLSNHSTPHTITSGQLQKNNNIVSPNQFPQTLPQITVADFAKEENVQNLSNNTDNANSLYGILDDADWENHASSESHFKENKQQNQCQTTNNFVSMDNSVINIDMNETNIDAFAFGNGVIEKLPKTTVVSASSPITANNWDDIFSVINLPKQSQTHTHFESNIPQPEPSTFNFNRHLPDAGASHNNAPAQIVLNKPNVNHQIHNNFAYIAQPPQLGPPVELPRQVPPPLQPADPKFFTIMANQQFDRLNGMNKPHNNLQEVLTNLDTQQNPPGPVELANQIRLRRDNAMRAPHSAGGVPRWQQQQPIAAPVLFPPYQPNGLQPVQSNMTGHLVNLTNIGANTLMAPPLNIKRKHTVTIPIKVVRSTEQYDTLVEMGFPKKDIEMALRKFDLDLHRSIEYLSESKYAEKRRKMDQNIHNQFDAATPNQIQPTIQQAEKETNKVIAEPKKLANLYEELLYLEETGGIVNSIESFDCDICMETIEMKDGIILRNCLHRYCKDCLNGTIVHSDDIDIKCPYVNCEEMLQDREIRAVLSKDEYEKYLMKGVRVAQVTISGTILCNLPDCNGWCICDDEVNVFKCPQCKNTNCIPCKAIHPDRNCREYQNDLAAGDANGIISGERRSDQAIQELINKKEAMKCPQCGILIMKRDGCDYIACVMCKTGICWATRGPRYGPGGIGDESGGCRCSVLKKCHKDCRGCH